MGKRFCQVLSGAKEILACSRCGAHLCSTDSIISKQFHGKHGRAYLVDDVQNCCYAAQEQKLLMTGVHVVRDIMCSGCGKGVGWSYDYAREDRERYKITRSVLEVALVQCLDYSKAAATRHQLTTAAPTVTTTGRRT